MIAQRSQDTHVRTALYLTMLDPIKAHATPQFNWYTFWTSLGTNGMPETLIHEGLKQTNQIKISFEKGSKDHRTHCA
jgi:hypothetical protein